MVTFVHIVGVMTMAMKKTLVSMICDINMDRERRDDNCAGDSCDDNDCNDYDEDNGTNDADRDYADYGDMMVMMTTIMTRYCWCCCWW